MSETRITVYRIFEMMYGIILCGIFLLGFEGALAFSSVCDDRVIRSSLSSTRLCGISEWRDAAVMAIDESDGASGIIAEKRRVPVIPIPPDQVVLPGEKKYFQFQTDDELRLFQRSLDRNHGIFALGAMIENDTMMSKLQLMEIQDYNMDVGDEFGIFCTAQAVGRARLYSLLENEKGTSVDGRTSIEEPLMAICEELFDQPESLHTLEETSEMARCLMEVVTTLSKKEEEASTASIEHDVRIVHDVYDADNNIDEDYDEYEETRQNRFARAYVDILDADSQGYIFTPSSRDGMLSYKQINAISWAAFSSSLTPSEDETYRLHALDQERISDRLKLATYWLSDVVQEEEQRSSSR